MEDNIEVQYITPEEFMNMFNISRPSLQKYLRNDPELRNVSKKEHGRRYFDLEKSKEWYNKQVTI